ncbi:unnamed protein product [Cylindrotheca closterium]|uniref:Uncharacterized protein n=1 Tax=Cylindrotheca closterium TaxID=2856 RepID=A0AAD2G654_9STRA|nr:unnamed protein product [Cylindrotheca closterium]
MGDFDVATIKSMFEKGAQVEEIAPKGRSQERRRTIATLGLSPGTFQTHKKSVIRNSQKQVRISPIPVCKKDGETEDTKKMVEKVSKPPLSKSVTKDTSMNRRMTMPISYSFVPPQTEYNEKTASKSKIKAARDVKDKDSSSPESKADGVSRGALKPSFSGKRNFFDRQSSSASDSKVAAIGKSKVKPRALAPKKAEKPGLKQSKAVKSETKSIQKKDEPKNVTKAAVKKDPNKSITKTIEKKDSNKSFKKVATEPKKVSKFAYTSIIKDKRASPYATMGHAGRRNSAYATTGHADRTNSNDGEQSLMSDPFPMRRQSLSDLPLPEHESVDVNDFHCSHGHSLGLLDELSEEVINGKKTVTREKDMNLLKDRKTVTSMIQQFSSRPTPIHGNKSHQLKSIQASMPQPPPPPIHEDDSLDLNTADDSDIIEEVTVVSEYTPSSSRHVGSDDDEDYSYEEVTATEADDFTETDSFMMSSVGMETASRASYTPSLKSQRRVVVDFQNMEMPASKIKEKHLKVVKDLDLLMTKSANQPETKVQRTIKDKMMQNLLNSNKSLVPEGVRQSLLQADLTIHEVSEIVAHLNMCEESNLPIRWDLIKDIVYPDEIDDETSKAFEEAMNLQGGAQSNLPPMSPSRVFPKKGQAATPTGTLGKAAAQELFRNQYDLSQDDMADIFAHLTLCEETGTPIRWDLVYQIVYPEDEMSADDSQTDPGSMMVDALDDNETVTSWYSIYPEFDECGSEVTFNIEEDDEVGSLSRTKIANPTGSKTDGISGQLSPQRPGPASDNPGLATQNDEQLLRKRIEQLQLASGKKGSFQVHKRKKGV